MVETDSDKHDHGDKKNEDEGEMSITQDEEVGSAPEAPSLSLDPIIKQIKDCILAMQRNNSTTRCNSNMPRSPIQRLAHLASSRPPFHRQMAVRWDPARELISALNNLQKQIQQEVQGGNFTAAKRHLQALAKIPLLIKTIMLHEDSVEFQSIMDHLCIRHVLCLKETALSIDDNSVSRDGVESRQDSWIMEILHSDNQPNIEARQLQLRAIEYLERISNLTIMDYTSVLLDEEELEAIELGVHHPSEISVNRFEDRREELLLAISGMNMLVPTLFSLPNDLIERAALTSVIELALNNAVQRPFVITLVFCDLLCYLVLLPVVRQSVILISLMNYKHSDEDSSGKDPRELGILSDVGYFFLFCLGPPSFFFYVWRTLAESLAFSQVSKKLVWQNLLFRWTLLDCLSIVFIVVALYLEAEDSKERPGLYGFNAILLCLVWARALGFLQNLNPRLATLVTSFMEIFRVLWKSMFILFIIVLCFGDMFYIIYVPFRDDRNVCSRSIEALLHGDGNEFESNLGLSGISQIRPASPFCKEDHAQSYMAVYRLVVGDINFNDFNATKFSSFLFVAVTFLCIIMLLNMIIAVIVDAYSSAISTSKGIFGRTRVAFVAKGLLMEMGMQAQTGIGSWMRGTFRVCYTALFSYILLFSFIWNSKQDDSKPYAVAVGCVGLFLMVYFPILRVADALKSRNFASTQQVLVHGVETPFRWFFAAPADGITRWLMGIPNSKELREKTTARQIPKLKVGSRDCQGTSHLIDWETRTASSILRSEKQIQDLKSLILEQRNDYLAEIQDLKVALLRMHRDASSEMNKSDPDGDDSENTT